MIKELRVKMKEAAKQLEFEEAALLRDKIKALEKKEFDMLSIA
jgi:excinuclease UvrABC nuclease subunit